ncbi:peptide hydrolase [Ktedonobacter sp. SOSP1-52]|uniref:S9 family peptidase n=1 Tax=Ktedonobacter sp. SOSP1-52 TaxID=2778366 RepID=UPI0019162C05|nr:prolyl oligopeptidase family serine peptidase [Ktedonobacter sp. SOSP1-52]GHO61279.1 peptide hydrolase [Ktedonobacter sp. SOSP1-52]
MLKKPLLEESAPWKRRFRASVLLDAQVARENPTRGIVVSNKASHVFQVYSWDVSTNAIVQLTHKPGGLFHVVLSPDGKFLYYLDDQGGDETGHFVRIPYEGGAPVDLTPHLPPYVVSQESVLYGLTISGSSRVLGGVVAHSGDFYLYCIDVGREDAIGEPRLLYSSPKLAMSPVLSYDGEVVVIAVTERTGTLQYTLLAVDVRSGECLGELEDGPGASLDLLAFSPLADDLRVLATSDRSGNMRPLLWNPRTGECHYLSLDDVEGEIRPLDWSADGKRLLLCQFRQAVQRLYIYDLESGEVRALHHPSGTYTQAQFGPENTIVATWQNAKHASCLIELDGETGQLKRTLISTDTIPEGQPWRSFTFSSTDGQEIQGWLCVPEGEGPFPTILETHGGPNAVTVERFDAACQAWVDHGFAFASINYRGSTTFGKQFLEQIWGNPGDLEVEDMVGARQWLVDQGIARPDQVLLTGRSYGGYLTLQALGKYPGLWAGGMGGVAVADRALQYQYSSDKHKGYIAGLFGGTPDEKLDQYRKSSPTTYVEHVTAPVLLIQGRNDTRCPARQVEVYEEQMRALGKHIEILWFDAGHGSPSVDDRIASQERMLRFAYQALGQ